MINTCLICFHVKLKWSDSLVQASKDTVLYLPDYLVSKFHLKEEEDWGEATWKSNMINNYWEGWLSESSDFHYTSAYLVLHYCSNQTVAICCVFWNIHKKTVHISSVNALAQLDLELALLHGCVTLYATFSTHRLLVNAQWSSVVDVEIWFNWQHGGVR